MIEGIPGSANRPAAAAADQRGIAPRRVIGRCGLDRTIRSPLLPPAVEIQEKKSLP
jgi:hypothetical protein